MRITGERTWGPPGDRGAMVSLLRRAVELGVELIDRGKIEKFAGKESRDGGVIQEARERRAVR
jgi:hypothetical protein